MFWSSGEHKYRRLRLGITQEKKKQNTQYARKFTVTRRRRLDNEYTKVMLTWELSPLEPGLSLY